VVHKSVDNAGAFAVYQEADLLRKPSLLELCSIKLAVTALEHDLDRVLLTVFGSSKNDYQVYVLPAKILCYIG
jgi:hypothetical protein